MSSLKHIFRIVFKSTLYPKDEYKVLHKRTLKVHEAFTFSTVPDDLHALYLSRARQKSFRESDSIFIIDQFPQEGITEHKTSLLFLKNTEKQVPIKIFSVTHIEGQYQFYLDYSNNRRIIGAPARDDFYLFTAQQDTPILFYINGYFDRGHGGNKTRSYLEQVFYIEYKGQQEIETDAIRSGESRVSLDIAGATVIDQRKLFY